MIKPNGRRHLRISIVDAGAHPEDDHTKDAGVGVDHVKRITGKADCDTIGSVEGSLQRQTILTTGQACSGQQRDRAIEGNAKDLVQAWRGHVEGAVGIGDLIGGVRLRSPFDRLFVVPLSDLALNAWPYLFKYETTGGVERVLFRVEYTVD